MKNEAKEGGLRPRVKAEREGRERVREKRGEGGVE